MFSGRVLLRLVEAGLSREDAYAVVQRNALRAWDEERPLRALLEADPDASALTPSALDEIFDLESFLVHVDRSSTARSQPPRWPMSDTSTLRDLHEASGKVREMYGFGDRLLMVASDRISAFDVVLPTPIPDKGRVLTGLSHFWFGRTEGIIPNHLITTELSAYPPEAQRAPTWPGARCW